ncbi:hypothetical protein B0H10DRAFT_2081634 [Mycena sp. CBHHK59/15]|nr:hypothetical protein B0H10DRAFT_2081634 [Mycena sp. CBHHK59/15]
MRVRSMSGTPMVPFKVPLPGPCPAIAGPTMGKPQVRRAPSWMAEAIPWTTDDRQELPTLALAAVVTHRRGTCEPRQGPLAAPGSWSLCTRAQAVGWCDRGGPS